MRRFLLAILAVLALGGFGAPPAGAAFGLHDFDLLITDEEGTADTPPAIATQAGSHPFALTNSFGINFHGKPHEAVADGKLRDFILRMLRGFVGDATVIPVCNTVEFLGDDCAPGSIVGTQVASIVNAGAFHTPGPIYNLQPPPGAAARIGWQVEDVPLVVDVSVEEAPSYAQMLAGESDHNILAATRNVNQTVAVFAAIAEIWGVPAVSDHDGLRGSCANFGEAVERKRLVAPEGGPLCSAGIIPKPFLTLPRACEGPLPVSYEATSWQGAFDSATILTHDHDGPEGFKGCEKLPFVPGMGTRPTTDSAETGTGLDFSLDFNDEGLKSPNPEARAQSDVEKMVVTLPAGVTVNPSIAEGLSVCKPADLDRETLAAEPGEGCPNASKIGTLSVQTPLLGEAIGGSVFLAQQDDPTTAQPGAENPFDSLIAFYVVLKNAQNGILIKQPARVEPDPRTGQLVTTVEDIPQFPFSHLDFHFREGQRAPLISPPACGVYKATAELTPRARPTETVTKTANFQILRGVGGGPCPAGGVPPFKPGFEAGSINNNAKSYSPFYMRLLRADGEQDMTKFSSVLPPGVIGKLAGVSECPDAQIAAAATRNGRAEQAAPSCPLNSRIGRTLAGAGVGSALTYVPGSLYLAGPYKGAPLSVAAITPAVAGPFDAGTVVVRVALDVNPDTAEVEVDGAKSDPIPHILKGIPLKVRELRVYVDRPEFTLNPTSCDPSSARATLFGSFLDLFSPADDVPVDLSARYQAANCASLGFKPKLFLRLKGGTRRGAHPALRATLTSRAKDANVGEIVTTLPRSAFLDQGHIRTICTRVQFAANACPKGAKYGEATIFTPLLEEPLQGPVYLRSSDNELPDLVVALHGIVDVNVVGRIDSFKGGIRASFEDLPDAPFSKAILRMQGGRKGLIVNSRNLCAKPSRATADFTAQSGKARRLRPAWRASCGKRTGSKGSAHKR